MSERIDLESFLGAAWVDRAVFGLRPDYRVLLIAVDGIEPGASDDLSESLLVRAERAGKRLLESQPVDQVPHVAAWREAYRSFGAKPQRTRNSLEALLRRTSTGLPRINRLTDIYNAMSVLHQIPLGGENLLKYQGPARLVRADGTEWFGTMSDGEETFEHPLPGEVIWRDDEGVTCRIWNWRQARRTQLESDTISALFIFDALDPIDDEALGAAGDELIEHLTASSPHLIAARRMIGGGTVES